MPNQSQGLDLQLGFELRDAMKQLAEFQKQTAKSLKDIEASSKKSFGDFQKQAKDSLKGVEDAAKKTADNMGRAFTAFKAVAATALAVMSAREVADFFKAGVDGALADEAALRRLQTALELTGSYSQKAFGDLSDFAEGMEKSTKFSSDLVVGQLALAKSFGTTNDGAKKLVQAAAELSSATGKDLETSVRELGKTLAGTTGRLKDQLPQLKHYTEAQLRAGAAIDVVLARFGGSAQREIETFGGSVLQLGNAFEDLQKAFGQIIIENPAVVGLIKGFTESFRTLTSFVGENKAKITAFISEFTLGFARQIPAVLTGIDSLSKAFSILTGDGQKSSVVSFFDRIALAIGFMTDEVLGLTSSILKLQATAEKFAPKGSVLGGVGGLFSFGQVGDGKQGTPGQRIGDDALVPSSTPSAAETSAKAIKEIEASIAALSELRRENLQRIADITGSGGGGPRTPSESGVGQIVDGWLKVLDRMEKDIAAAASGKAPAGAPGGPGNNSPTTGGMTAYTYRPDGRRMGPADWLANSNDAAGFGGVGDLDIFGGFVDVLQKEAKTFGQTVGISFAANIGGGEEGARKFVGDAAGAMATAFGASGPVAGGVAALFATLGQDPETFGPAIEAFVQGVPKIIDNIIANIPTLVIAIAENAGPIITSLAAAMPKVAVALAQSMPAVATALWEQFSAGVSYQVATFGEAFNKAAADITGAGERFNAWMDSIGRKWQAAWDSITGKVEAKFETIMQGLKEFFETLGTPFRKSVAAAAVEFVAPLRKFIEGLSFKAPGSSIGRDGWIPGQQPWDPTEIGNLGSTSAVMRVQNTLPADMRLREAEAVATPSGIEGLLAEVRDTLGVLVAKAGQSGTRTAPLEVKLVLDREVLATAILGLNTQHARLAR